MLIASSGPHAAVRALSATGGDGVPAGEQVFLDDAGAWGFTAPLVGPVSPLDP